MFKNPNHVHGPTGLTVPGHLNFAEFMLDKLWQFKDNTAMIDASTKQSATYGDILEASINFAVSLSRMGVRKGQVIGIISENRTEYWGAVIGVACTGAVLTTICPTYVKDELKNALNISKPKMLICSPSAYKSHECTFRSVPYVDTLIVFGREPVARALLYEDLVQKQVEYRGFECAAVDGQTDTLFVVYSSGTTGLPKGVMLTHLNVITACCLPISHDPSEASLTISPWYHVMGLVGFIAGLALGRTGVYLKNFDVDLYLRTIEEYEITQLTVVPPVLVAVCKCARVYNLSSVRLVYSGAAPLLKETADHVTHTFPNVESVLQGYGASETTLGVIRFDLSMSNAARHKPGSVGKVVHGTTVKVADLESRQAVGANQRGEICVKGWMLMKGYVGISDSDDYDDEGFYKTGDVGYYDEDGFFYIVDRLKELIKYKGFQVPPAELEALLLTHPSVKDVGVIGIPHKSGGEVPLAFIVVQTGTHVTEEGLKKFVAERLSNPKHLRGGVKFVDLIPKSASGKIIRKELRQLYKIGKSKL